MKQILNLTLFLLALTVCQAQRSTLSLNLEKEKVYNQNMNSKIDVTQTIDGQEITFAMSVSGAMAYLVTAVGDTYYEMDVTYKSLSMEMQLPQMTMSFSSENNDQDDFFSKTLAKMKDKPFSVTMAKNGKVKAIKNLNALFDAVLNEEQIPESEKQALKKQLEDAYGEDAFKGSIEMVTAIFPENPVAKGGTWVIETTLKSQLAANVKTTYKLKEVHNAYYKIHGNSEIETTESATMESNGIPLKYELKGVMISDIKVDRNSGWIIEAMINQDIQGHIYIKEDGEAIGEVKIPMLMKSEIVITDK